MLNKNIDIIFLAHMYLESMVKFILKNKFIWLFMNCLDLIKKKLLIHILIQSMLLKQHPVGFS